jgi:hypothetical protein
VDTDPKFDPDVRRDVSIQRCYAFPDIERVAGRVYRACKLDQHAVAGGLNDATAVSGDGRVNDGLPDRLKVGQRSFLIETHETAVPSDVSR